MGIECAHCHATLEDGEIFTGITIGFNGESVPACSVECLEALSLNCMDRDDFARLVGYARQHAIPPDEDPETGQKTYTVDMRSYDYIIELGDRYADEELNA